MPKLTQRLFLLLGGASDRWSFARSCRPRDNCRPGGGGIDGLHHLGAFPFPCNVRLLILLRSFSSASTRRFKLRNSCAIPTLNLSDTERRMAGDAERLLPTTSGFWIRLTGRKASSPVFIYLFIDSGSIPRVVLFMNCLGQFSSTKVLRIHFTPLFCRQAPVRDSDRPSSQGKTSRVHAQFP